MQTTDPEYYQEPSDCVGVDTDILRRARDIAQSIYSTCGGRWRADRMESAMRSIDAELASRGVIDELAARVGGSDA